jgi:hypothetical protein
VSARKFVSLFISNSVKELLGYVCHPRIPEQIIVPVLLSFKTSPHLTVLNRGTSSF